VKEMDWRNLEEFKGIDLNDSFILSWEQSTEKLTFELIISIWPESEFYTKPHPDEYTCYRKGTLSFTGIESLVGLASMESTRYSTDPDGSIDYGNIDSLVKSERGFNLGGEFGEVTVGGGKLHFEIHT
jgi:hypothetical protein